MKNPEGIATESLNEFERYFYEQMTHAERIDFESRLKQDHQFYKDFMIYKSFFAEKRIRSFKGDIRELSFLARRKMSVAKELTGSGFLSLLGAIVVFVVVVLIFWSLKH